MSKALRYKGYTASVAFDPEDLILTGRIEGIGDVVGFHADTAEGLVAAFHEAVDDYLDACARAGKRPDKPYSGRLLFRVPPELHAQAAAAARAAGKSLNAWAQEALRKAAEAGGKGRHQPEA